MVRRLFDLPDAAKGCVETVAIGVGFALFGPARQALARGRGGWSQDPFWFRIECLGFTIVLALCALGLVANRIIRRRDEEAHQFAKRLAAPDEGEEFLKSL